MGRKENDKVGIYNCHGMGGNQVWAYTGDDEIRCDDICLDVARKGANVLMIKCHHQKGNQLWNYNDEVRISYFT